VSNCVRAFDAIEESRYLDGFSASSGLSAFAWATGLGKLGGVSQRFIGGDKNWDMVTKREAKLRSIRRRTSLIESPKELKDLGSRIDLL
jgi:hypothetical protein